jgi:pimeloyl-ACP methyl ester carboxylesterase
MTTATVGGVVAEIEGDGFPVVTLHGLGGTSNMFQPLMRTLAGHRVVRIDMPGSGRSPRPAAGFGMASIVAAVREALRALGVERGHFVGHSMGTIVCQHLAAGEPGLVASLTLFGALAEPTDATREALGARARTARAGGMAEIADQIVAGALAAATRESSPAAVAFVRESVMRQDPECYALTCEALAEAEAADARRIAAPALLVTGDADAVNPVGVAQALADAIRGATLATLDRCGHWTTVERPEDCARRLGDFLARV